MCKHSNVKPFKCNTCQKSFSEKTKLSRHMSLHSAGKNFICPDCAKSFKTKDSLRIHSLIHRNEKPFACKVCSARFNNSSNLKKHLASHSGKYSLKKPYFIYIYLKPLSSGIIFKILILCHQNKAVFIVWI